VIAVRTHLSTHTRKTSNRIAVQLRLVAVSVGRTNTALGAFYRRLGIGKAKAVPATARKIAVLFLQRHGVRHGVPGSRADQYERRYRDCVIKQLRRRAGEFGFKLQEAEPSGVSSESVSLLRSGTEVIHQLITEWVGNAPVKHVQERELSGQCGD